MTTAKLKQQSLLNLVKDCNMHVAGLRSAVQGLGTPADGPQLRREIETAIKNCMRSYEATKEIVQLKDECVEFTKHAAQFIACVSACVVEMKRCEALEKTFEQADASYPLASPHIASLEQILETLENLITVHYSTSEATPESKVTPRRRRGGTCRPQCLCCSKLKTSYA